jgi:hypothetical protein
VSPPVFPARGPSTDCEELVQLDDQRDTIQASPDELPMIAIHSVCPVLDARHRTPGIGGLGDGLR